MRQGTSFLKVVVFLIGITIFGLCFYLLPLIATEAVEHYILYPVLIGLYVSAISFFIALNHALRLLNYIDQNKAFSDLSVIALKNIKYCAITIGILYVVIMPIIYIVAEIDDAPGIIVVGLVIIFASIVVAAFAAVLQKLLKNAIDIKLENDLTV